jgi:phosphoribosylaminoimidazolecarboxamide formyltransferase / IMP cyclohydrolase
MSIGKTKTTGPTPAGDSTITIRRALLSVTDKSGVAELGRTLAAHGVELIASGGTAATLREAGCTVTAVEAMTHFPEMLDGRVKTLHPAVHAGILADRSHPGHRRDLETHGLGTIDLLVVNFYDFATASAEESLPIEAIDIGGPTLARAGAKNCAWVTVLSDPSEYAPFLAALEAQALDLDWRRGAAARTFARVAAYDNAIAERFAAVTEPAAEGAARAWPQVWVRPRVRMPLTLRYGENPHQAAAVYRDEPAWGLGRMRQTAGVELSFNNLLDAEAALALVRDLGAGPACVLVKHNNPCGVATGPSAAEAFRAALACDPTSAFGGIAAFNRPVDGATASEIGDLFLEVLCATSVLPEAREVLAGKKRLRILEVPDDAHPYLDEKRLHGLVLVQEPDAGWPDLDTLEVVTRRAPDDAERADLAFLMRVCKHVRSNAIVIGKASRTLGIGAGQMSRVDSCELAVRKAHAQGHDLAGSAAASDAFFPFADGVEALAAAGVRAIVQPGGSKRDPEVIAAADRLGLAMVCTGRRHFRH